IPLTRPEVYYGLKSLDYVIANSGMQEFNYPGQEGPVYTHYEGDGGVVLSSWFRRLLYAWKFADLNILISGEIQPDSRIQYRRVVAERFATIAPFLLRDREAYSVVADGRLFWIQDAYTVTDRYPYSTAYGRFNYIREGRRGRLHRRCRLLPLRPRRPPGPGVRPHLPRALPSGRRDARLPARPRPGPPGPVHRPDPDAAPVPHAGPGGLLQQGGPVVGPGPELLRPVPGPAALLHRGPAARRGARGVPPDPAVHAGQPAQ
ncbi:MAG: hypothetical protein GWM90_30250, partial [Gemmatimonadetes bacterium]|nr:hypothetical protein [Gemmatimonadota bacterium]NIQ59413.1 hypothetical protein [Gemmatimonadota bacterium]NIU79602.1 hypothetical protein [Gammaproteobacteria bacterium]NIX48189.1 hypothetical protein [Gemmatimonadota bacterium]NIY12600.1 hypothetical protein [Gemmatimonadota bacterium]